MKLPLLIALLALRTVTTELPHALIGSWVGTLEYRDYSDDSREKLGTLLRIYKHEGDDRLVFRYVYDDGPHKVVQDEDLVQIDEAKNSYVQFSSDGQESDRYSITGLAGLTDGGFGTFSLTGKGTENGVSVEVRETFRIQSDSLDILRESKLPGKAWLFRHEFSFKRVIQPKAK